MEDVDKESLLVAFLSEFLYFFDVEELIFKTVSSISLNELEDGTWKLHATAEGEKYDPEKHIPDTEVKAITYSYISIVEEETHTQIKIVYDI